MDCSTLIASAVRLPYLHELNQSEDPTCTLPIFPFPRPHYPFPNSNPSSTGQVVDVCIWSVAELGSAIALSSVPAIRPLMSHLFPNIIKSSAGSGAKGSHPSGHGSSLATKQGTFKHSRNGSVGEPFPYVELDERKGSRSASSQEYILAGGEHGITKTVDFQVESVVHR